MAGIPNFAMRAELNRKIDEVKSRMVNRFYAHSTSGVLTDSDDGRILNLQIFGNATQDGTPTWDNSIEIVGVEQINVKYIDIDGTEQTRTIIPPRTLYGIDGYTDMCDVEKGVWNYALKKHVFKTSSDYSYYNKKYSDTINELGYKPTDMLSTRNVRTFCTKAVSGAENYKVTLWDSAVYVKFPKSVEIEDVLGEDFYVLYPFAKHDLKVINADDLAFLRDIKTKFGTTNIEITDQNGNDISFMFDYPVSLATGWEYIKEQIGDTREYVYNFEMLSKEKIESLDNAIIELYEQGE